jgi:hypothetical protein
VSLKKTVNINIQGVFFFFLGYFSGGSKGRRVFVVDFGLLCHTRPKFLSILRELIYKNNILERALLAKISLQT